MAAPAAWRGTLMHTPCLGAVEVLSDHLLVTDATGCIAHMGPADTAAAAAALRSAGLAAADVTALSATQMLLPGFIDAHAHAPQTFFGVGTDLPLFEWLNTYTFPAEAAFADADHAAALYRRVVSRLLSLGTTTANYFTTLHVPACKALADAVVAAGQRAVLGKVCMDQHSPDDYVDASAEAALAGARDVVQYVKGLHCSRLVPCVIPRFIPTCSQQLLAGLGALAAETGGCNVHSHMSESRDAVQFSRRLHPGAPHDAAVYDAAGLLRRGAVFAHATQATAQELQLLASRGAGLAHCPLSNFFFGDGLLDVCGALAAGVAVGLGTDIAGGYSPSMLVAMRMAVINSHALKAAALMHGKADEEAAQQQQQQEEEEEEQQQQQQGGEPVSGAPAGPAGSRAAAAISNPAVSRAARAHMLTWEDALWLATAGGAAALGLSHKIGTFARGMEFDALLLDAAAPDCAFDILDSAHVSQPLLLLEHVLNNGDDRNILEVWVQGRRCK